MTTYDDNYPTCRETYATLRLFSDHVDPREITTALKVAPSESFAKGEASGGSRSRKTHGWFLSSKGAVDSKDSRRHIDWIVSQLRGRANELRELQSKAVEIDISCFWLSVGQGGPTISPYQMREVGELNIDVSWDVYFGDADS